MSQLQFLFAGFAVFWGALFVYLLTLQGRLRALRREIDRLEERLAEADAARTATATPPRDAAVRMVQRALERWFPSPSRFEVVNGSYV